MIIKHSSMRKIFHVNDLVFVIPLPLLTMLLAILLEETTLKGGEEGVSVKSHKYMTSRVKKAGFSRSSKCLNISATGCSWLSRKSEGI